MPWGMSPQSNIRRLLQVPKTDTPISKVGPLFVRNNPKRPHLHEKSLKVIITNPLRKSINRKRIEEEGVRHQKVRNQRVREEERKTERKSPQEEGRQLYYKYELSSSEAFHCRISIYPLQQVNCEPSKIVNPLTEVWARTKWFHKTYPFIVCGTHVERRYLYRVAQK